MSPIIFKEKQPIDKNKMWQHPGGKFRRVGPYACNETELLAIILGSGSRGKSAEKIAQEIIDNYGTLYDLSGKSLKELMQIKGLKEVKATQLAAVFEISKRILKHMETI